jgi:hypothetical protein
MANIIPNSFRGALFEANHNFKASGGNNFSISLYTTNPYSTASTVALLGTGNGEVSTVGTNYSVKALTRLGVASSTAVASVDFDNVSYTSASFTAAFAAIYNTDTVDGTANRLVVVLDFGGDKTATNGTFTITFPDPATPANAIISMS